MPNNKNDFKPYIPAERVVPEFTVTSILIGVLLAIVFGAANAYLGLRVGMTISASIPAAVISMGIIRMILRKDSTWFRPSVLPVSPLLPVPSSPCPHSSCGQRKASSIPRAW